MASGPGWAAREGVVVSGVELVAAILGGVFAAVLLGALVWSDYRDAEATQLLQRTADQHQARGDR